jgi:hypothetical protein
MSVDDGAGHICQALTQGDVMTAKAENALADCYYKVERCGYGGHGGSLVPPDTR